MTEYSRRASSQCSIVSVRRCRSFFCLFIQNKGIDGAESSAIKIEKYNSVLNSFEEAAEISLRDRMHYGVILQKKQVYILGGAINNVWQKSVSATSRKLRRNE